MARFTAGDPDPKSTFDWDNVDLCSGFDHLKEVDPEAAKRIHPNDHRKVRFPADLLTQSIIWLILSIFSLSLKFFKMVNRVSIVFVFLGIYRMY